MRKIFIIICFAVISGMASAQTIISTTISPSYPTTSDTITLITECMFPSGSCDGAAILTAGGGPYIYADAMHCMGMLSVICTDYDTVQLAPLPAGQYHYIFTLSAGHGIPCTPGIAVDDVDTISFFVDDATGIADPGSKNLFTVSPNPSDGRMTIRNHSGEISQVSILSSLGKVVDSFIMNETKDIDLPPGIYFIQSESNDVWQVSKVVVR